MRRAGPGLTAEEQEATIGRLFGYLRRNFRGGDDVADETTEGVVEAPAAPASPMTAEQYRAWAMSWWASALSRPVLLGEAGRRFVTGQQAFWRAATTEECQRGADATPDHA